MTRIRTPRFPTALAQAVRAYVQAADRDEADIALEVELLRSGVMIPDETIERIEADAFGAIIFFEHGEVIFADINGSVDSATRD